MRACVRACVCMCVMCMYIHISDPCYSCLYTSVCIATYTMIHNNIDTLNCSSSPALYFAVVSRSIRASSTQIFQSSECLESTPQKTTEMQRTEDNYTEGMSWMMWSG